MAISLTPLEIGLIINNHGTNSKKSLDLIADEYSPLINKSRNSIIISVGAARVYKYIMNFPTFSNMDKKLFKNKAHHLYYIAQIDKKYWVNLCKYMMTDIITWSYTFTKNVANKLSIVLSKYNQEYIDKNIDDIIGKIVTEFKSKMLKYNKNKDIIIELTDGDFIYYKTTSEVITAKAINSIMQTGVSCNSSDGELEYISPSTIKRITVK